MLPRDVAAIPFPGRALARAELVAVHAGNALGCKAFFIAGEKAHARVARRP